jgi:hypothetical protein
MLEDDRRSINVYAIILKEYFVGKPRSNGRRSVYSIPLGIIAIFDLLQSFKDKLYANISGHKHFL